MRKKATSLDYRQAADKVWELAKYYENLGIYDLAQLIKDLAGQVHDAAREKEKED